MALPRTLIDPRLIYLEPAVREYARGQEVLARFPDAELVEVTSHWKIAQLKDPALAEDWRRRIGIRTDDVANPLLSLSGGNQQKVLFARALATGAPLIIMDDPMRGVDIGTKTDVYDMIRAEARKGRTFLWYSTETEEMTLCDRVYVFRDGRIAAELARHEVSEESILTASFEMAGEMAGAPA